MKLGKKGFAALGGTFILTTCIVQPIGYTAEITAPAKPIYMVNQGTQYFDSTSGSISFTRSQNGILYLSDVAGNQLMAFQGNQTSTDHDAVYEITKLDMQNPTRTFFVINATIGVHPMNTGSWIIGEEGGKWKPFVTRETLGRAGYDLRLPQRLSIVATGDEAIYLTSKHEGMPRPDQSMAQAPLTTVFRAGIRWDDSKHNFNVYSLSDNSSSSATSSSTGSASSSRINQYSPRMPMDQARIGGIGIGDSIDYVKSIYGEPTSVGQRGKNYLYDGLYAYDMTYGDSFKLSVVENSDGTEEVIDIASTANNGLAMPCGIKVGSSIGEVYKNFGMPWRINSAKSIERNYVYRTQYSPKVVFTTNQQHTITRITIIGME